MVEMEPAINLLFNFCICVHFTKGMASYRLKLITLNLFIYFFPNTCDMFIYVINVIL